MVWRWDAGYRYITQLGEYLTISMYSISIRVCDYLINISGFAWKQDTARPNLPTFQPEQTTNPLVALRF